MIIKEKSIKSHKGLENALHYVLSKGLEGTGIILRRFLRGDRPFETFLELAEGNLEESSIIMEKRIANLLKQFKENDALRQIKRKNGVKYYHSILSFHKEDQITKEALLKTARRYAKERYPKSQVVFIPHYDKAHVHLHALAGAVEFQNGKVHRLTRKEFAQMKGRMEAWQDRELGLVHSRINHSKKKRATASS